MIHHLPEGNHRRAEFRRVEVVEVLPRHARKPLEEVAVRQGPFPAALAAEDSEQLPGFVAQADLPGDVVVAADRMIRIGALARTDGIRRVDEVAPRSEQPLDLRQVLRPHGQFDLLRRADHVRPAAQPPPALDQGAVGLLLDHRRIPALRVAVHVLVVVVQAGHVVERLDPPHRVGQCLVSTTLRVGGQVVGMPAVVASLGPAADHEQAAADPHVAMQVLGDRRGLVERPPHADRLLGGALLVHPPRQARPELEVGSADHPFHVRVPLDLLTQRHRLAFLLGNAAVAGGQRVPVSLA